jgi:hypothetical protein
MSIIEDIFVCEGQGGSNYLKSFKFSHHVIIWIYNIHIFDGIIVRGFKFGLSQTIVFLECRWTKNVKSYSMLTLSKFYFHVAINFNENHILKYGWLFFKMDS